MPTSAQARAETLAELARFACGADEVTLLNFGTALATVVGEQVHRRIGHNGCPTCTCEPTTFVDCRWCGHRVGKVAKRAWDYCSRTCRDQAEAAQARARAAQEAADRAAYGTPAATGHRTHTQQVLESPSWRGASLAMSSTATPVQQPDLVIDWPYPESDEAAARARRDRDDEVRAARALFGTKPGVGYDPDRMEGSSV